MKTAIMQPYFFPYIGYFQLIDAVDLFVVYDNIKYTKKGWINRNRILHPPGWEMFSLPLKGDSDFLEVRQRRLAVDFKPDPLLNRIRGAYHRAPHFGSTYGLIEEILRYKEVNLFGFLYHSIQKICQHLGIIPRWAVSSTLPIDHTLTHQHKVLALCEAVGTEVYVNASGGRDLYAPADFRDRGMALRFIHSKPIEYQQFGAPFVPWLSIIDVMMFNSVTTIREQLMPSYELVQLP